MSTPENSPLGRDAAYPERVDAGVLFAIPRAAQRAAIGVDHPAPFHGEDVWTAYELSWLGPRGKPHVAIATLRVPATSPAIVESKSLKLYLNGYAHERHDDGEAVARRLAVDLAACCGADVGVELWADASMDTLPRAWLSGQSLDDIELDIAHYEAPVPELLVAGAGHGDGGRDRVEETLVSRLFRSNCPVTGQPDWADVQIRYRGQPIDHAGLLAYLLSYRRHRGFHEQCVERIFVDIRSRCRPDTLTVLARFTRRGGLDINPWRSDDPEFAAPENARTARQ